MNRRLVFSLQFGLVFAILNCSKQINNNEQKPSPAEFLTAASDTAWIERGIDAVPESNSIQLEWVRHEDDEVIGYELYRSQNRNGSFSKLAGAEVLTDSDTLFLDGPLSLNVRYFYYLVAVNYRDERSEPSDTLDYMLIEKAVNLVPSGSISTGQPVLSWEPPVIEQAYVIRIREVGNESRVWMALVPSTYSVRESARYNFDHSAALDPLASGKTYQWRIDVLSARDRCGSESPWITLIIE